MTEMNQELRLPGCLDVTLTLVWRTCFALGSAQCWGEGWWDLLPLPQSQTLQHIQSMPQKTQEK